MLTTGEIAKLFQVSAQTVINWLDQGRIPFERIGRGPRRLTEENVLKYIKDIGISPSTLDQNIFQRTLKKTNPESRDLKDSIVILDKNMVIVIWSEEMEAAVKIPRSEANGRYFSSFVKKVEASQQGIDYILKNNWLSDTIEADIIIKGRKEKQARVHITVSKYFSNTGLAGYVLVCQHLLKSNV